MGSEQKRAFLAVVLSGIVLFTWQYFFAPKHSQAPVQQKKEKVVQADGQAGQPISETRTEEGDKVAQAQADVPAGEVSVEEKVLQISGGGKSYSLSSRAQVVDATSELAVFGFEELFGSKRGAPFQLFVQGQAGAQPLSFDKFELVNGRIEGLDSARNIKLSAGVTDKGLLDVKLTSPSSYSYQMVFRSTEKELENKQMRKFVWFTNELNESMVGDDEEAEGKIQWAGLDFNYHFFGAVLENKALTQMKATTEGNLVIELAKGTPTLDLKFLFAKKNFDYLASLKYNLDKVVDFGFFGIVAVPILRGLQFFYKFIPNYGVSIILLTFLIRLILSPLQYKSYKSMKKMQEVQPELNRLREKFKDDPQRMQRETMELFKKAGANPLGGCLPLILQMPVFFAFYKVLYASVELVGAPFVGWIHDLSNKDPWFVLPVLMVLAMVGQQKLTPTTTADPTQKKIMMVMPLVFGFIMKDLPAGLVLYIFVSTVFGIAQQLLVYRTSST